MTFQGHPVRQAVLNGETIEYVADQLVVKFKKAFARDPQARRRVIEVLPQRSSVDQQFGQNSPAIVRLPEGSDPMTVAERLSHREEVEFAEPNYLHSGE